MLNSCDVADYLDAFEKGQLFALTRLIRQNRQLVTYLAY